MKTISCKAGCRHETYTLCDSTYNKDYVCGISQKSKCPKNDHCSWEPVVAIVLENNKENIAKMLRENSLKLTAISIKQIKVYSDKAKELYTQLDENIKNGKFVTDGYGINFKEYCFSVSNYFIPLYESGRYSPSKEEVDGMFCSKCNSDNNFELFVPAIVIETEKKHSHTNTMRGGLSTSWNETTVQCPMCKEIETIHGYHHEEADKDEYDYH